MSEEKLTNEISTDRNRSWPLSKWLDQDLFKPSGDKSEALFNCYSTTQCNRKLHLGHAWDTTFKI